MANYSKGKISIPNVTGNLVINITAVPKVVPIVNLVDVYGVAEGYRVSSSSGANTAQSGYCAIGSDNTNGHVIPVSAGDVFRFKGAQIPTTLDTKCLGVWYDDASGTHSSRVAGYIYQGYVGANFTTSEADANGVVTLIVTELPSDKSAIRFAIPCTNAANLVITKNQVFT